MALSPVSGAPVVATMDQTADLWLKIDQFHLNYLKSDENTKKIDIRKKLEGKEDCSCHLNALKQALNDLPFSGAAR